MRFAWLIVLMGLVGCSVGVPRPGVGVESVRLMEGSPVAARAAVVVRLENRSDVALPVQRVDYAVDGPGGADYAGSLSPNRVIPPGGAQTVELPAVLAPAGAAPADGWADLPVRVSGTVVYRPPGELRRTLTQLQVPLPSVRFGTQAVLGDGARD